MTRKEFLAGSAAFAAAIDFEKGAVKMPEFGDNEFPTPGVQS